MRRLTPNCDPWTELAAVLVSHATRQGNVCLDLSVPVEPGFQDADTEPPSPEPPDPDQWIQRLSKSGVVGRPGQYRPMILEDTRLYLQRYWYYEQVIAAFIQERIAPDAKIEVMDLESDDFSAGDQDQNEAIRLALKSRFCVISGGPGTGKTFTLARIIEKLQNRASDMPLRIKLAAPTGKAAAHLQTAIEASLRPEDAGEALATAGLEEAQTLHRLLGIDPVTGQSRFHAVRPLQADVVMVDEASMIDVSMMAKLALAMPRQARLILSGDKDQLSSVEAGAVLGDICQGKMPKEVKHPPDPDAWPWAEADHLDSHIVLLRRNFRFGAHSGIQALSQAVNRGDAAEVNSMLAQPGFPDIRFQAIHEWNDLKSLLEQEIRREMVSWFGRDDPQTTLDLIDRFKILTVLRNGPFGVDHMNLLVETTLSRMGLVPPRRQTGPHWYPGRPVMILRNDHAHGLFNGDVGVAFHRGGDGAQDLHVAFRDHHKGLRYFSRYQLPPHETAYAITVHKSQGSEFEHVLLVLPDRDTPLLTRELLYTAVTRARRKVTIIGKPGQAVSAVNRSIQRASGLRAKILSRIDH